MIHPRFARVARLVLGGLMLAALLGCSSGAPALRGRKPVGAAFVGHVSSTEVRSDGPERPFAFKASPGKLLFVTFGYTSCPDICPTTLSDLRRALRDVGPLASSVEMAFVTVDINRDTAAVLAPYVRSFVPTGHAIRPHQQSELGPVQSAFGATSTVTRAVDGSVQVSHTGTSYLVDERGRVLVEWPFGIGAKDMAHDLKALLGAGKRPA